MKGKKSGKKHNQHILLPDCFFRVCTGAVLMKASGDVLAFERTDFPGSWQFPQGGLQEGEDPLQAIQREVTEETGIKSENLQLMAEYPGWLVYELPADQRDRKLG